jgi:hypothetical protein
VLATRLFRTSWSVGVGLLLGLAALPAHAGPSSGGCTIANGDPMDIALIVVVGLLTLTLPLRRRR